MKPGKPLLLIVVLWRYIIRPVTRRYAIRSGATPDALRDHGATIYPGRTIDQTGALSAARRPKKPP